MRRRAVLAAGFAGLCSGCVPSFLSVSGPSEVRTGGALARINAFRASNGLPELASSATASRAARQQAEAMAASGTMRHNIGFGADFSRRMKKAGVALPAAENIATGQATVDGALEAWENSASHRANTLSPLFTGVGVAVAYDGPGGRPYWAMVLTGG